MLCDPKIFNFFSMSPSLGGGGVFKGDWVNITNLRCRYLVVKKVDFGMEDEYNIIGIGLIGDKYVSLANTGSFLLFRFTLYIHHNPNGVTYPRP